MYNIVLFLIGIWAFRVNSGHIFKLFLYSHEV